VKRVVLVNDLSGIGRCSLGVQIPVLSCLGLHVSPVATAVLTNQTAYPDYRISELPEHIENCSQAWSGLSLRCDGFVTGFFRSGAQINAALKLYNTIKNENSLLVVDPIMGDDGAKYSSFDDNLCEAIKNAAKTADVITPNFTEACMLSGTDYNTLTMQNHSKDYLITVKECFGKLLDDSKIAVIVTGIRYFQNGKEWIYNLMLTDSEAVFSCNAAKKGTFSGAGDLFAALFAGHIINGKDMLYAFENASDFVAKAVENTNEKSDRREGLDFEPLLNLLLDNTH
jgi:pyridoxine kinase